MCSRNTTSTQRKSLLSMDLDDLHFKMYHIIDVIAVKIILRTNGYLIQIWLVGLYNNFLVSDIILENENCICTFQTCKQLCCITWLKLVRTHINYSFTMPPYFLNNLSLYTYYIGRMSILI